MCASLVQLRVQSAASYFQETNKILIMAFSIFSTHDTLIWTLLLQRSANLPRAFINADSRRKWKIDCWRLWWMKIELISTTCDTPPIHHWSQLVSVNEAVNQSPVVKVTVMTGAAERETWLNNVLIKLYNMSLAIRPTLSVCLTRGAWQS